MRKGDKKRDAADASAESGLPKAKRTVPPRSAIIADCLQRLRVRLAEDRYGFDPIVVAEMIVARDQSPAAIERLPGAMERALPSDDAAAIHREVIAIVAAACVELPPQEALVLQLAMVEELNTAEISAVLDEPEAYVASLRKIALGRIRMRIGDAIG